MAGRAGLVALVLAAPPALAAEPPRPLTGAEQRLLDGAYLYLVSPDYCDLAHPAERLRAWIADRIRENGIPPEGAAAYLAENEWRLKLIAEAAFGGRRGKALCRSLHESPDLRKK